ncbi:MAG: AraC family transcriptional regulator [Verrucomicrobiota bacterium]
MMNAKSLSEKFCQQLADDAQLATLFDFLPETYFFVKDLKGRFVLANQAVLSTLGLKFLSQLIGQTDYDFFTASLADKYREEDDLVIKSGKALFDQVWLVPNQDNELRWYLSSKRPLHDKNGDIIGVAGVMRDFDTAGAVLGPYESLSKVIAHIQSNYQQKIEIPQLAKIAHLSISQLERRFKNLFKITPLKYIHQVRIHAASKLLNTTREPIGNIALDCGFYDQSHFTRQFKSVHGVSPLEYRKEHSSTTRASPPKGI